MQLLCSNGYCKNSAIVAANADTIFSKSAIPEKFLLMDQQRELKGELDAQTTYMRMQGLRTWIASRDTMGPFASMEECRR